MTTKNLIVNAAMTLRFLSDDDREDSAQCCVFVAFEGDNEIAIFADQIGSFEVRIFNYGQDEPLMMSDASFENLRDAMGEITDFLTAECAGAF